MRLSIRSVLILLAAVLAFTDNKTAAGPDRPLPNVIIISLDGLRPDHLGCYGHEGNTSANIDKLAQESIVFKNAFSQSSLPLVSHLSLLISRYPDFFPEAGLSKGNPMLLSGKKTLAHILRNAGYLSAIFNAALPISKENSRTLGFDDVYVTNNNDKLFSQLHQLILKHHDAQLFLMVYCRNLNLPKQRKNKDYDNSQLTAAIESYDSLISASDSYLGRLFKMLKVIGLWDNTLLVVTSGYGQELMEHDCIGRCTTLYDTMIRVPLIIKLPKNQALAKSVSQLSELVDIMPTVLDIIDIPVDEKRQGRSLLALMQAKAVPEKNIVFSAAANAAAVRTADYKYILIEKEYSQKEQFYDLRHDRNEKKNLAKISSPVIEKNRDMLKACLFKGRD